MTGMCCDVCVAAAFLGLRSCFKIAGLAELEFRGYVAAVQASGEASPEARTQAALTPRLAEFELRECNRLWISRYISELSSCCLLCHHECGSTQEHEECDESGIKPELESFEESAWDQHEHEDWRELSTTQKPAEAVPGKKTRGGQRKRPKRKADSMESSFHLSFEGKHPKAAVNMFLFRYTGRDVIKDEDFGTAAKRDPMASNAVCTSRHGEAEQSTSAKLANQVPRRRCPLQRSSCKILTMLRLQSTYRRQCGW